MDPDSVFVLPEPWEGSSAHREVAGRAPVTSRLVARSNVAVIRNPVSGLTVKSQSLY